MCAAALLATSPLAGSQTASRLPALGDGASDDMAVGDERRLGDRIMRDIRRDPDYLDDPVLLDHLQSLWQPLLAAARARGDIGPDLDGRFAWEAFLVRDKSVNAFALPGGYIGVHLGLIGMTASRDELASVLAHELSHVTQRHISRSINNSQRQSLIGIAGMILGVLIATRSKSADGANAVLAGSQAVATQGQLNFSRDMEREADRIGFSLMAGGGFAPSGMAAMFEKLDHASRLNDSASFPYLRSHPLNAERIGEARARLGSAPSAAPTTQLTHAAAQARARVLMDTRSDALRRWQALDGAKDKDATKDATKESTSPAERLSNACASALASTLLRDWPRADAALQTALDLVRGNPRSEPSAERLVVLLQVQSKLERGEADNAAELLRPLLRGAAPSRPVLLLSAQVALAQKDETALKQAAERLQTWVTLHPADSTAWQQLGRTWVPLGQPLRSLRAEAESRVALGDYNGALDRLRAGQRLAKSTPQVDFIDASIIDSRLRDVEVQRRQQALEERAEGS